MGVAAHKNSCNGEVLMVDAKKNGKKVKLLLQSVPVGPGRNIKSVMEVAQHIGNNTVRCIMGQILDLQVVVRFHLGQHQ